MPYKSDAQRKWAHTESGKKALGASGVKEWDSASKGLKLPKRVTEHAKHFELEAHDGALVKVAKKGLGPKVLHRLQGMCMGGAVKMADGGAVEAENDPSPLNIDVSALPLQDQIALGSAMAQESNARNFPATPKPQVTGYTLDPMTGDQIPQYAEPPATPQPQAGGSAADASANAFNTAQMPQAPQAPALPSIGGGYGVNEQKELKQSDAKRMAGATEAASVQAQLGQQEAQAMQAHQDAMLAKQAIHDEQAKKIQAEIEKTEGEIKDGKIDPNRWFADKSTGGKISSILGMIIGGFGAGLSHGPNLAMELMNKQIDRDIAAQKDNLASKNNLVSLYYKKLGNLDEATQRAKADMQAALQVKVAQLGSLAKGDTAKANLKMFEGQLQEQRLKLGSDLATAASARELQRIHAAIGRAQLGAGPEMDKALQDRVTFQTSAIAGAEKQLEHMEKSAAVKAGVLGGAKGLLPGDRTAADWEAGRNLAVNELAKISKQGVPDKDEVERFLHTVPGPSASSAEKLNWIKNTREYLKGQKQALNAQFKRQGKRAPYEDVSDDIDEIKAIR